ncbi:MAG: DUF6157 family protein [Pirellulales bacterium]
MTTIVDSFVTVAPDCPVERAVVPTPRGEKVPVHALQYELLTAKPYHYTHETLILETELRRANLTRADAKTKQAFREKLFSKSHACLRASALSQKYGWGVHYDAAGKIALYAMESAAYRNYSAGKSGGPQVVAAMRSKKTAS